MWNELAYRRHMPHYQNRDRTFLVTFVTRNRWVLLPAARDIVIAEIIRQHEDRAFILTAVVMPDHVHLVMQPLWDSNGVGLSLSEIHRLIKGRSARRINQLLDRKGAVWQGESHDHQIRSDESLVEKCEYVAQNPVRKGLCGTPVSGRGSSGGGKMGQAEACPTRGACHVPTV